MTLKVLHVAETVKGGVATVIRQLISNDKRFDFHLIAPEDQKKEVLSPDASSIITFNRTGRNIRSFIDLGVTFFKAVRKIKPDVIHLHSTFAGVICRLLIKLIPGSGQPKIIYCPHSFSFMMDCNESKKKIYALVEKLLQPLTNEIICVSQYEMDEGVKWGMNKSLLRVVHNSVEMPKSVEGINSPYMNSDKINILFVGRFDFQKGYDLVIELANRLDDRYHITIIGGAVHSSNSAIVHPLITYAGWLTSKEIAPYMAFGDLLFMPSRWESFGLVAVEAESYGMPVVATNCTALPEVVNVNKTGFLFEKNNIQQAFDLIIKYSKNDWSNMSNDCIDFYYKNFTSDKMRTETYKLYM